MRIDPVVFPALLLAACVVPAMAQSAPSSTAPAKPGTVLTSAFVPRDSRVQIPSLSSVRSPKQEPLQPGIDLLKLQSPPVLMAKSNSVCYAMRSYQFAQTDPTSDATTLKGSSTCVPATETHLKGAYTLKGVSTIQR